MSHAQRNNAGDSRQQTQLDRIEVELKRLNAKVGRILLAIRHHDIKADGLAEAKLPWADFEKPRRDQIEAVLAYLREHKKDDPTYYTVNRACYETYRPRRKGYPSAAALSAYCYALPITHFA